MMRRNIILITVFVFIGIEAYSQEWQDRYNVLLEAYQNMNYQLVIEEGPDCLLSAESEFGARSKAYGYTLKLLSSSCLQLEMYSKGVSYGRQEVKILTSVLSTTSPEFASSLKTLAYNLQGNGNLENSMENLKEVSNIYLVNFGENSMEYAAASSDIGYLYYQMGATEMAIAFFERARGLYADLPDGGADFLQISYDLANIYMNAEKLVEALELFQQVKQILEDNQLTGESMYSSSLAGMAKVQVLNSDFDEAEKNYIKAINAGNNTASNEGSDGSRHVTELMELYQSMGNLRKADSLVRLYSIGDSQQETEETGVNQLINLGAQYHNQNDYVRAEEYYRKALGLFDDQKNLPEWQKARLLENISKLYYDQGLFSKSEAYALQALSLYESNLGKENNGYISALNTMGMIMGAMGYYTDAENRYKDAIRIFENNAGLNETIYADILEKLSSLYLKMGRFEMAKPILDLSTELQLRLSGALSSAYAKTLMNQAAYFRMRGDYQEAERLYLESMNISLSAGDMLSVNIMESLGRLYLELGQFEKSDSLLNRALDANGSFYGEESKPVAENLLDLARLKQATGEYSLAEDYYRESLRLFEVHLGNRNPDYLNCLNSMGVFYQLLGNTDNARDIYKEIIEVADQTFPLYATALQNLSTLYQMEEDYESAKPLLLESLKKDSLIYGPKHPEYASSLQNLASLYHRMDDLDKAEDLYRESIRIDAETYGTHHPSYARKIYNLAVLLQDKEEYEEALTYFKEALDIRKNTLGPNHPDYSYSLYGLAVLYLSMEKPNLAHPLFNEVISNYQKQVQDIFPVLSEKEKTAFYNKIRPVFEDYRDFVIEYSNQSPVALGDLFDLQLNTKAILLNSSAKVRDRILRSDNRELVDTYNNWLQLKDQLVKYYSLTNKELEDQNIDLRSLESRINDLEKSLSERSQLFSSEYDRKLVTWQDIRNSLKPGEAAIEIIRIRKNLRNDSIIYAALIVRPETRDHPELVVLDDGMEMEGREYSRYINTIRFTVPNEESYKLFWSPFLSVIGDSHTVYLSPDGIYNKLNLNTLWDKSSDQYLIDKIKIKLVSNLSELIIGKSTTVRAAKKAYLIGYPDYDMNRYDDSTLADAQTISTSASPFRNGIEDLPGSRVEIEKLDQLLSDAQWATDKLMGQDAVEENIKNISSPLVLHMATHGFFLDNIGLNRRAATDLEYAYQQAGQNPLLRSGLVFAGAENTLRRRSLGLDLDLSGEDGILTAYEAMNLNLDNTELVVLSACETGLGEVKNGEGVYGLQRAFVVAGADHVIMSLWKVNDEVTQKLMADFYEKWLSDMDMIDAFREAQRSIKEEHPEPFFWGAFILIGK